MAPPSTPTAPPSSPLLNASNPDLHSQRCLPTQYNVLKYLNEQLEEQVCKDDDRYSQIVSFNRPSRRFLWQSECSSSSDDGCTTEDPCTQLTSLADDDGATLVDVLSPVRSDCSEATTLSGGSIDSSYPFFACWKDNLPKLDYCPCKAWSATMPLRRSAAHRSTILQRPDPPIFHTPKYQASCPSRAAHANWPVSPPVMQSTSIDPPHSAPSPQSMDVRSQSWPSFTDGTCNPGLASHVPPEHSEKSYWDPDSSDDEKDMADQEQSLGKLRRRFGRRVSDTLRPLWCRT